MGVATVSALGTVSGTKKSLIDISRMEGKKEGRKGEQNGRERRRN